MDHFAETPHGADVEPAAAPQVPESPPANPTRGVVAGMIAGGLALATGELVAGIMSQDSGLVVAVGTLVIDLAPPAVEDFGISTFGTADKPALVIGIVTLSVLFGGLLGRLALDNFRWAALGFLGFAGVGIVAGFNDPMLSGAYAVAGPLVAVAVGLVALWRLAGRDAAPAQASDERARRAFLATAGATLGVGVVALAAGRWLLGRERRSVSADRGTVGLPPPEDPAEPPPPAASFAVAGLTPIVVPNDEFYRIDTALVVPRVDAGSWRVGVTGMVDDPYTLTYQELLDMPMVERYVTLSCVSNRVGGDLVGNALWLGVPLSEILDRAGVQPGATQVVGRAVDDFTVGFPTEAVYDGREALLAVGMNGEPLPFEHGFPARLVVAGLYGYVSATKWLAEIELTTLEGFDAYWVPRGWAKEAPIKTQSRIDVPGNRDRLTAGPQPIAGVAWAPNRGISRVEVRIDGGEWEDAEISVPLSEDSWVQWRYAWRADPGNHLIAVRATDGTGETQTAEQQPPRPDGATGYHGIRVEVA